MTDKEITKNVKRDYTKKISDRCDNLNLDPKVVNEFITLINYCFLNKNNFFVENFNTKSTKNIYLFYNHLKTNILNKDNYLFKDIEKNYVKSVKFVLTNFICNYDNICEKDNFVKSLCGKESMIKFVDILSTI